MSRTAFFFLYGSVRPGAYASCQRPGQGPQPRSVYVRNLGAERTRLLGDKQGVAFASEPRRRLHRLADMVSKLVTLSHMIRSPAF